MISDLVICGFGRLGTTFGCSALGFEPDSITVAKALTSAYLPLAGVTVPQPMYEAMLDESRKIGIFGHGFTYSGHPVAAAVALKALDSYADRIVDAVAHQGAYFQARLRAPGEHPLVGEARGFGLVWDQLVADKRSKGSFDARPPSLRRPHFAQEEGLIVRFRGRCRIDLSAAHHHPAEIDELLIARPRSIVACNGHARFG